MSDSNTQSVVEPLVRIYNKRAHTLTHGKHKAVAQAFSTISKSVAEGWMKQFPGEIVDASTAQKEINGATAEAQELREKLAAAQKQVEVLEAKPANAGKLGAQLDAANKRADAAEAATVALNKRIAELEEQLTEPAKVPLGSDMV